MDKNKVYRGKRANKYVKKHTQEMCDFFYDNINSGVKGYDFLDMQIYPNIKVQGNRYYKKHIARRKRRYGAYCFNYMESINEQISKSYEVDSKKYVIMYQGRFVWVTGTTSYLNSSKRDETRFICVDDISELGELDFYDRVSATQMLNIHSWKKLDDKKYVSSKELIIVEVKEAK